MRWAAVLNLQKLRGVAGFKYVSRRQIRWTIIYFKYIANEEAQYCKHAIEIIQCSQCTVSTTRPNIFIFHIYRALQVCGILVWLQYFHLQHPSCVDIGHTQSTWKTRPTSSWGPTHTCRCSSSDCRKHQTSHTCILHSPSSDCGQSQISIYS